MREWISIKHFICMSILFIFGSSVVMGVNTDSGTTSWLSFMIAWVFILPLLLIYARLMKLHPEKNIFEMLVITFGKKIGKVIVAVFMFFCLHLGTLVMRNFSEFIKIVVMPDTPEIVILILMLTPIAYLTKSGLNTLGKWSAVSCIVLVGIVLITGMLSYNIYNLDNMLPLFDVSVGTLFNSSVKISAYPFGEMVILLTVADAVGKKINPYKAFLWGAYLSALVLLVVLARNILTLGTMMKHVNFPSFTQAKIISISDSFERIEGLISFNFILAGITKISICTIGLCKGFTVIFDSDDYKKFAFPSSFLMLAVSTILYRNVMEMFEFLNYYHYYSVIFEAAIPIILWTVSEICKKRPVKTDSLSAKNKLSKAPE